MRSRQNAVPSARRSGDSRPRAAATDRATLFAYVLMLIAGTWFFRSAVWPEPSPTIHTERKPGIHVTLVVVAPTAKPPDEMVAIVEDAIAAVGQSTRDAGMFFSTIGVSDDWSVERGLGLLRAFGHFDEVIVGRNWFNSGIVMFVEGLEGPAVVPQIVVVRQKKTIIEGRWTYGPMEELARAPGLAEMSKWAMSGFPIERTGVSTSPSH